MVRALAASLAVLSLVTPAAFGKGDVRATLIAPVDLDARPGEQVTLRWSLEDRTGAPFGAGELFVRLRSATGGKSTTAVVAGGGRISARVTVPEGGIGGIELGVVGYQTPAGAEPRRGDLVFPLTNDPFAEASGSGSDSSGDRGVPRLALGLLVGASAALLTVAARRAHRPTRLPSG